MRRRTASAIVAFALAACSLFPACAAEKDQCPAGQHRAEGRNARCVPDGPSATPSWKPRDYFHRYYGGYRGYGWGYGGRGYHGGHYHGWADTTTSAKPPLTPVRAYLRAQDIPPADIGAYGIVALKATPTAATKDRLQMLCAAYVASLPRQESIPAKVPAQDRMLTIWPLRDPDADDAQKDNCDGVLANYDLYAGESAIQDAQKQGAQLDGEGPFLIGWSPSSARGVKDKVVLVVDMTPFRSQDSFDHAFMFWKEKIVEDPSLWRSGFVLERIRLQVRDFADRYGQDILEAVKLIGVK